MGKAVARKRKTKTQTLMEAQRALELHVAGVEDIAICQELGISRATLYRRIAWARSIVLDPTVEEYRAEAVARIREARRRVYARLNEQTRVLYDPAKGTMVEVTTDAGAVSTLIGRLVQLEDTEAKIRGGYAPTKVDVKVERADAWAALEAELAKAAATPTEQEAPADA